MNTTSSVPIRELSDHNYVRHADPAGAGDMSSAVTKRKDGPAYELKSFHNDVKEGLLRRFVRVPYASVLDVGCGRGGDLWKFARHGNIARLVCIDACEVEIREAEVRYETVKKKYPDLQASFHVLDATDPCIQWPVHSSSVAVVSFMFCLHYMFESDETLTRVLRRAYDALIPGGYCIGTIADGDAIMAHDTDDRENSIVRIDMDVAGPGTYRMRLLDTVIDDVGTYEYVARESQFIRCAEFAGFVPMTSYDLEGRVVGDNAVFKRFSPRYSGESRLEYELASSLYSSFCLRKILS